MGNSPQLPDGNETIQSLAARIKAKYPVYADRPDADLVKRVIDKYPQYQKRLSTEELKKVAAGPVPSLWQEAKGVLSTAGEAAAKFYPQVAESTAAMLRQASPTGLSGAETARNIATPSGVTQSIAEAPAKSLAGKIALGAIPGTRTALSAADLAKRAAGGKPLTGESISQLQKDVASGAGQLAVSARAPEIEGLAEKGVRKLALKSPKEAAAEGWRELLRSKPTGIKEGFKGKYDQLANTGHLKAIADMEPQTYRGAYDATKQHMADFYDKSIQSGVDANAGELVKSQPIAEAIKALETPTISKFFPEQAKAIEREAARFEGKTATVAECMEALKILNQVTKRMQQMAPEDRASVERVDASKAALDRATDELRNQIYDTLERKGVKGIRSYQLQYGALKEFREMLRRNIVRAEKAEANKPSYKEIPRRAISRHELLAGGIVTGGLVEPKMLPALTVLPAMEAIDIYAERARTPDAALKRSFDAIRRSQLPVVREGAPSTPPLPNIRGLLTEGPRITPPPPDTSYVRGIPAQAEAPEAIRKGRLLPQGEGVGPIPSPPSPLSPVAGSEPTPTGGARGYTTKPQPDFPYGGSVTGNSAELAVPEHAKTGRMLKSGSAEMYDPNSGSAPQPGQILRFQGSYWMFNGEEWQYLPPRSVPALPERRIR